MQTNPSSCPYPITTGDFPMPSTAERNDANYANVDAVPVGMLSPYYRDRITLADNVPPTGASINGAGGGHVQHNSIPSAPSAPYANGNSGGQWSQSRGTTGFSNPMADQFESNPSDPPPSYNDLFTTPKNGTLPRTVSNGIPANQTPATSPRAIVVPRTVTATGSRIITHAPVRLVGVRSNTNNNGNGVWVVVAVTLIVALAIFVVFVHASARY